MSRPAFRAPDRRSPKTASATATFDRILCGYDGSERSVAAVRQAALLRAPMGRVLCVAASDERWWPLPGEAARMLDELAQSFGSPDWLETRPVEGPPVWTLERLAVGLEATLLAVGAPRGSRIRSAVSGDVAGCLLRHGLASVLVARPSGGDWPARVVVGIDGSDFAASALRVARSVARRLDAPLMPLAAGDAADAASREGFELPGIQLDRSPPVDALVATAAPEDLLVVGSRGLSGPSSLGSVSERVAHAADCSVLVVHARGTRRRPVADGDTRGAAAAVHVGELMSRDVVSVSASRCLVEVAELVLERGLEIVAVENSAGRFLGLLTVDELLGVGDAHVPETPLRWPRFLDEPIWSEAELAELFGAAGARAVGELVQPPRTVLGEGDTAFRAAELLAEHRVSRLPVLRGRRLIGIVSAADLLRLAVGGRR